METRGRIRAVSNNVTQEKDRIRLWLCLLHPKERFPMGVEI